MPRKPATKGTQVHRPEWALRLIQARKDAGFPQERIAERVGKSQSAYGDYETGKSEPDHATWRRIAESFGVSPGWLAFGVGGRSPDQGNADFWNAMEAHNDSPQLALAISQVARMLAEEQIGTNIAFIFQLGMKLARAVDGIKDQLEARERILALIETERAEIREGLERLRKSRL